MRRVVLMVLVAACLGCSMTDDKSEATGDGVFALKSGDGACYGNTFHLNDAPVPVCPANYGLCVNYDDGNDDPDDTDFNDMCCAYAGSDTCDPDGAEHGPCQAPLCNGKYVQMSGADICDTYAEPCPERECPEGCQISDKCTVTAADEYFYGCVDGSGECMHCSDPTSPNDGLEDLLCEIRLEVCRCEPIPEIGPAGGTSTCGRYTAIQDLACITLDTSGIIECEFE
ncbi:MAG: hypothetical protein GY716_23320 [bacterium]|nr:hypothetical protein [bacterium]